MSQSSKRHAQSPLDGEGADNKRRNISEDPPPLISLEEIPDEDSHSDVEPDPPTTVLGDKDKDNLPQARTLTTDEKVDKLIDRMDRFLDCFHTVQKTSKKEQRNNNRKFKHLEQAHNDLISKVVNSATLNDEKFEQLEERLAQSELMNKDLTDKIANLEARQERQVAVQHAINTDNSKKMNVLELNQGYTDRNVLNLGSEVKERKIIISRVYESRNEDVITLALECINKVINAAIAGLPADAGLNGLRILMPQAIDNVYRIGKPRSGSARNISVTFMRKDEKEMVCRARSATKDCDNIRFFISDDLTEDGRAVKAQLRRISSAAQTRGHESKVTGNKVVIDSRSYASNEIALIPKTISSDLKQEKYIDGGIVYRGDRTIFSNFFPAPFNLGGIDYVHTEQYYQYHKATHHGDDETAERILNLTNPWRIKVLGDNIEPDKEWISRRMKVMYDANSAKFRHNWPLHDELLRSKGLKLYEATTDMYWACGVGYDSKKWTTMDWKGENVAGLIVMKVRDELLQELSGFHSDDNTLTGIANESNNSLNMVTDQDECPLESTMIHREHYHKPDSTNLSEGHSQEPLYTDVIKSHGRMHGEFSLPARGGPNVFGRGGHIRGRGRSPRHHSNPAPGWLQNRNTGSTRGRGGYGRSYNRGYSPNLKRPYVRMSDGERAFLHGPSSTAPNSPRVPDKDGYITPRKTSKSPVANASKPPVDNARMLNYPDLNSLTEHQKKGLIDLGLLPDSDFVKNIVSVTKMSTGTTQI